MRMHLTKTNTFNLQNLLILIRMLLIPYYLWQFGLGEFCDAFIVIMLSIITALFEILLEEQPRKITSCGKTLNHLADELTQFALVITLHSIRPELRTLLIILSVKFLGVCFLCRTTLHRNHTLLGNPRYEKLNSVIHYSLLTNLLLYPGMSAISGTLLILVCELSAVISFVLYCYFSVRLLCKPEIEAQEGEI